MSCSKKFCKEEYGEFVRWASRMLKPEVFERIPAWGDVKDWPGKVVGSCDYACNERTASAPGGLSAPRGEGAAGTVTWDEGYPYWWRLSEVVAFDHPIPCRGNVGMWQMPPELARQVNAADALASCAGERIATAEDALRVFQSAVHLAGGNEGVFVLPLDKGRRVLGEPVLVSLGDPSTTVVQSGEVFAVAFNAGASAIIVAHNHPSGDPSPSLQDRQLTSVLVELGEQLGIEVLDHLVLGEGRSVSLLTEKKMS